MYTLIGAITLFLILVTFHEYGHYSVARFFNIKIQKFSIGFGNDLIKWKNKDGVRFSISAIPLGGYVAFDDPHDIENYKKLTEEEKSRVLANRPAIERMLVTLAGPIYNFILAFVVFAFVGLFIPKQSDLVSATVEEYGNSKIFKVLAVNDETVASAQDFEMKLLNLSGMTGTIEIDLLDYQTQEQTSVTKDVVNLAFDQENAPSSLFAITPYRDFEPIIGEIESSSIADLAGLKQGDKILQINSMEIQSLLHANTMLNQYGRQIELVVQRTDANARINLPAKTEGTTYGIRLAPESNDLASSIKYGADQTIFWITNTFNILFKMVSGSMGLESLSGPVGIAKVAGDSLSSGFIPFLLLLAILSISLGAFNLLPLPMLDGGQFLFIVVETIKGSAINLKLKVALFNLSYLFIMALFVFVIFNDLARVF